MVSAPEAPYSCLAGGGEMGALMRAFDWSATSLGPVQNWPPSLKTAISICLNSQVPIVLCWGPELITLYNDACIPMLGTRHPAGAPGRPARECWAEIQDAIGPLLEHVMTAGEGGQADDVCLFIHRGSYVEEKSFRFSSSPIREESGAVGGIFTVLAETAEPSSNRQRGLHEEAREQVEAARRRELFLARSGAILASSLEIDRTLAAISELAVPGIADWCAVDLIEAEGPPRRVTVRHSNPELLAKCIELRAKYPPAED